MYNLRKNPILYHYQIKLLISFFASPFGKQFFLTGGTALAAFYLGHRESQDLDLFSLEPFESLSMRTTLENLAKENGAKLTFNIRSQTYNEAILENTKDKWSQKIDIVQEQPIRFEDIQKIDNIAIDSLVNITTNKILAILGRLEVKDYIDLYFIFTQTELSFDRMFELAKKKDTGLNEFNFASTIVDVAQFQTLPKLKLPLNRIKFQKFYQDLSKRLYLQIKPTDRA